MARRDVKNGTSARRRGPGRVALWAPFVLTAALLGSAVAADQWAWGPQYLGWKGGDPVNDPAAVDAPGILGLGAVPTVGTVAADAPSGTPLEQLVSAAIGGRASDDDLGKHTVTLVSGLDGVPVFSHGRDALVPASTAKILTATAALELLGPDERFSTTVEQGSDPSDLVLVGGGDPYLVEKPAAAEAFPERADLTTLARETAAVLAETGTTKVRLNYDTSLFDGPAVNPEWEPGYTDDVVSPITSLWIDQGRNPDGWRRLEDPALAAARAFAKALTQQGLEVSEPFEGQVSGSTEIAAVKSAPLAQIVERVLDVSDNDGAEVLARHVGLAVGEDGSFEQGAAGILSTLAGLGIDVSDADLKDGSGLSRQNHVKAETLLQTLAVAASEAHPHLRPVIDGLPVAGFTGSLTQRFAAGADDGLGRVRAKTGTLTGVHVLAGLVTGADGVPMLFVTGADRVEPPKTLAARATLDQIAAALAGCACATPTDPTAADPQAPESSSDTAQGS